jgi:long-chain acyl-CoA synthetase
MASRIEVRSPVMSSTGRRALELSPLDGLGQLLPRVAARYGGKVALVTDERNLTFDDLDHESSRVARSLAGRGIGPGDRVALLSQNRWEWIVAYHGVLKLTYGQLGC